MSGKLTNSVSKLVKSLKQKKYRDLNGLFVVEGVKLVGEAIDAANAKVEMVVYTGEISDFDYILPENAYYASPKELEIISGLQTPNRIMAVCRKMEEVNAIDFSGPVLALDGVSDPGNLGTIIRLCDWFGFSQIICDHRTVDVYNPKVVQASMGGIFRVSVRYTELPAFIENLPKEQGVFGADMDGISIYDADMGASPLIIMGSEAHGLSEAVSKLVPNKISIPRYGQGESLNVAISSGIIAAELRRRFS